MIIDSHQHFWDVQREDCNWPTPDLKQIYKSFSPEDYLQAVEDLHIEGSVLVQSQPSESDTEYLLKLADENERILGVVGWADLTSPDVEQSINSLVLNSKLKGLRPMLQAISDNEWILRDDLKSGIEAMVSNGLCFDALIQPRHLSTITEFARVNSDLPIVVDHAAKPDIVNGEFSEWSKGISVLAELPNVYCKLSGLLTEATQEQLENPDCFLPYIRHLVSSFGSQKLMWGSDWPVVNLRCTYAYWLKMSKGVLETCGLSVDEQAQVFRENTENFYKLK